MEQISTASGVRYPKTQKIIAELCDKYVKHLIKNSVIVPGKGRPVTTGTAELAERFHVGPGTITAWLKGESCPKTDLHFNALADAAAKIGGDGARSTAAIRQSIKEDEAELADSQPKLHILRHPPLSGMRFGAGEHSAGGLDMILGRCLEVIHPFAKASVSYRSGADDPEANLRNEKNAIYTCMFDTLNRQHDFTTFHSPLRIGLNAVFLGEENIEATVLDLQRVLSGTRLDGGPHHPSVPRYVPITPKGQAGFSYLRSLGFSPDPVVDDELKVDLEVFLSERLRSVQDASKREQKVAFVLIDEVRALKVVQTLAQTLAREQSPLSPVLVFPIATEESVRQPCRRNLPVFLVGLATIEKDRDKVFTDSLRDGLRMLLVTESETIATFYFAMRTALVEEIAECLRGIQEADPACFKRIFNAQMEPVAIPSQWNLGCALRFAQYALRLGQREPKILFDTLNLPRAHIVDRAREMILDPPDGTESVREGRFRIAFRPLAPVTVLPGTERSLAEKLGPNLERPIVDLSNLGFIGQLLRPFSHLVDPTEVTKLTRGPKDSEHDRAVEASREDVAVGFLETYNRARFWKFYRLPFFVPLNAVILKSDCSRLAAEGYDMDHLRKAISPFSDPKDATWDKVTALRGRLSFIVLDGGAGSDLFLQQADGFAPEKIRVASSPDASVYVQKILEARSDDVPVVVIQVMNCLNIIKLLADRNNPGTLVFDPRNIDRLQIESKEVVVGPTMPEFNAPIAVRRESQRWIDFFDYAMPRHLAEDETRIRSLVEKLKLDLKTVLEGLIKAPPADVEASWNPMGYKLTPEVLIEAMANHFLCLDPRGKDRLPQEWEKILLPLRQRLGG